MGLSKRERIIVLVTIICVGALVGDKLVRAPLASGWEQLKSDRQELAAQVAKAKNLLERQSQLEKSGTLSAGLLSDAETESGVAKALDKWAQDARLALTSVKPDRMASGDKGLKEILFVIAGTGSLDAVAWFLYQVETSELPIKVKYMQVGSTSESGSSMTLELRLSALYLAADEKSSPKQSQPKQKETKNEEQLL